MAQNIFNTDPIDFRKGIPLFYSKTEREYNVDPYERYDPMVIRQSAIHLCDDLWSGYPFQTALDFVLNEIKDLKVENAIEIGCGVGRLAAEIALAKPSVQVWGIDYSYQMLKRAKEAWLDNKPIEIPLEKYGFNMFTFKPKPIKNLQFGLAKASQLPFESKSQDVVLSSFLLDRVDDPMACLKEMQRVIRPKGKIILIHTFNYQREAHWQNFYPLEKFIQQIKSIGLEVLSLNTELTIQEPLDRHGNFVCWKGVGMGLG